MSTPKFYGGKGQREGGQTQQRQQLYEKQEALLLLTWREAHRAISWV